MGATLIGASFPPDGRASRGAFEIHILQRTLEPLMKLKRTWANHFVFAGLLLVTATAQAAPYDLIRTYYGTNKSWLYGWSMAPVGSNKILVGSLQDNTAASAAGAAYLMDATNGNILLTLPNPTPAEYDFFGHAVLPVGNNLLVGANWDGHVFGAGATYPGAAYLFDGATGGLLRTFKAPAAGGFSYGSALALVGNNILIAEESGPNNSETAYLYDAASGNLVRTISNIGSRSGMTSPNSFVAAAGTNVLIGRPGDNNDAGGASLYDTTNGSLLRMFSNPVVTGRDDFGFTVAVLPGNRFAISAPFADRGATNAGAVYIFDGSTGALLRTLLDPHASADGNFGLSIAAVGDDLLVGAPYDDLGAPNAGVAYLFSATSGNLLHTFLNPTPQDSDWFGQSVSALGSNFLIAAAEDNTMAPQAGAVYLYAGVPEPSTIVLSAFGSLGFIGFIVGRRRRLKAPNKSVSGWPGLDRREAPVHRHQSQCNRGFGCASSPGHPGTVRRT
jgi:hypothetical protein